MAILGYTGRGDLHLIVNNAIRDQVLCFHTKTNLLSARHLGGRLAYREEPQPLVDPRDTELALLPSEGAALALSGSEQRHGPARRGSTRKFNPDRAVPFATVRALLESSFGGGSGERSGRPYPSGGRIYSVDVLVGLFASRVDEMPGASVLHLRALSDLLEPIANPPEPRLREVALDRDDGTPATAPLAIESPAFFVLYAMHLDKALVRYRYRGYRFALVESGAMCHQADLVGQTLGLGSCLYGGFGDNELAAVMGVNPAVLLPLVVQFFGYPSAQGSSAPLSDSPVEPM